MEKRTVGVNERGYRIAEDHPHAVLTDAEVELIRQLHEDDGLPYNVLAEIFGVSISAVGKVCRYERRAQTPTAWKTIVPKEF